jgi:hypothetical protein
MSGNGGISIEQMIPLGLAIAATVATDGAAAPLIEEAAGATLAEGVVAESLPVVLGDTLTSGVLPDIAAGVAPETWASGTEALNPVGLNDVVGNTAVPSPTTQPIPVEQPPVLQQNYLSSGRDYGGNAFGEYGGTTDLAEPPAPTTTTTTQPAAETVNVQQGLRNPYPAPGTATTGTANASAPLSEATKQAALQKGAADPSWWSTLSPTTKMAITGAGTLGLGALLKADNSRYGTPGTQTYTGPLSQFSYNPNTFKPTTVAQPTPYKAHYATGGLASTNAFAGGGSPVPYDPNTQTYTGVYAAPTAEQNQQTINNLARMQQQQQQQIAYDQAGMYGANDNTGGVGVGGPGTGGPGGEAGNAGAGEGGDGSGGVGSAAQGGIMRARRMAYGGTVEEMSRNNAIGANQMYPQSDVISNAYASPTNNPISTDILTSSADADVNPYTGAERLKKGGIAAAAPANNMQAIDDYIAATKQEGGLQQVMAKAKAGDYNAMIALNKLGGTPNQNYAMGGGVGHLGGYSDGGRMLKGPGDGMSDDIPASIAGKQPARLADNEFVVPADVVSHLGNGSSDAGARKLYKMMDNVRKARTGKKKQAPQIKSDKYMPA